MSEKLEVHVGGVPMDKLEEWANKIPRFAEVMADDSWLQNAYEAALKELKERECPDELVERYITKKLFAVIMTQNLLVIFARASVQGHFDHKSEETIVNETLSNPEWLSKATETAVEWFVNTTVEMFNEMSMTRGITCIISCGPADHKEGHNDEIGEPESACCGEADDEGRGTECGCDGNCSTCYGDSYGCGAHHGDSSGCDGCDDCDEQ